MAADDVVGSASVEITPQFDAFERALHEGVEGGLTKSRAELRKFDTDFKHLSTTVTKLGKQIRKDLALDKPLKQLDQMTKSTAKLSREVRNLSIQVSVELTRNVTRLKTEFTGAANEAERMNKAVQAAVKASKDLKGAKVDFNITATVGDVKKLSTEIKTSRTEADKLSKSLNAVSTSATSATSKVTGLRRELGAAAAEAEALGTALSNVASGDVDRLAAGLATAAGNASSLTRNLSDVTAEAGRARAQMDALAASAAAIPHSVSVNVSSTGGGTRTGGSTGAATGGGSGVGGGILASLIAAQLLRSQTIDQRRGAQAGGGSGSGSGDVPRGGPTPPTVNPDDLGAIKDLNREMERASILRRNLAEQAGEIIDVTEMRQETEAVADLVDSLSDLTRVNFDAAQSSAIKYLNTIVALRNELGEFEHSFEMVRRGMAGFDQQIFDNELDEYAARLTDARKQASAYVATLEGVRAGLASGGASDEFLADLDAQIVAAREAETATMSLEERQNIAAKSAQILAGMEDTLRKQYQSTGAAALSTASGVEIFGTANEEAAASIRRLTGDTGAIDFAAVGEGARSAWKWVKALFTDTNAEPIKEDLVAVDSLVQDVVTATARLDFGAFDFAGAGAARESLKSITTTLAEMEHAERMAVRESVTLLDNFARMKQAHAPMPIARGGGSTERDDAIAARTAINELNKAMVALDEAHGGIARSSNPSLQAMKRFTAEIVHQEDELEGHSLNPALNRTAEALRRVHVEAAGAEGSFGGLTGGMAEADHALLKIRETIEEADHVVEMFQQDLNEFNSNGFTGVADDLSMGVSEDDLTRPWRAAVMTIEEFTRATQEAYDASLQLENELDRIGLEFGDEGDAVREFAENVVDGLDYIKRDIQDVLADMETLFEEHRNSTVFDSFLNDVAEAEDAVQRLVREAGQLGESGVGVTGGAGLDLADVAELSRMREELVAIQQELIDTAQEAADLYATLNDTPLQETEWTNLGRGFDQLTESVDDAIQSIESLQTGARVFGDEFDVIGALKQTDLFIANLIELGAEWSHAEIGLASFTAREQSSITTTGELLAEITRLLAGLTGLDNRLNDNESFGDAKFRALQGRFSDLRGEALQFALQLKSGIEEVNSGVGSPAGTLLDPATFAAARTEAAGLLKIMDKISAAVATGTGVDFLAPRTQDVNVALERAGQQLDKTGAAEAGDPEGSLRRQVELANELAGRYQKALDIVAKIDEALNRAGGGAASTRSISGLQAQLPAVAEHNQGVDLASTPEAVQRANSALDDLDALLAENAASMDRLTRAAEGFDDELEGHSLTPAVGRLGEAIRGTHVDMAGFENSFGSLSSASTELEARLDVLRKGYEALAAATRDLDGGDPAGLLAGLDALEMGVTEFRRTFLEGNREMRTETGRLLSQLEDLGTHLGQLDDEFELTRTVREVDDFVNGMDAAVVSTEQIAEQVTKIQSVMGNLARDFETSAFYADRLPLEGSLTTLINHAATLADDADRLRVALDAVGMGGLDDDLRDMQDIFESVNTQAAELIDRLATGAGSALRSEMHALAGEIGVIEEGLTGLDDSFAAFGTLTTPLDRSITGTVTVVQRFVEHLNEMQGELEDLRGLTGRVFDGLDAASAITAFQEVNRLGGLVQERIDAIARSGARLGERFHFGYVTERVEALGQSVDTLRTKLTGLAFSDVVDTGTFEVAKGDLERLITMVAHLQAEKEYAALTGNVFDEEDIALLEEATTSTRNLEQALKEVAQVKLEATDAELQRIQSTFAELQGRVESFGTAGNDTIGDLSRIAMALIDLKNASVEAANAYDTFGGVSWDADEMTRQIQQQQYALSQLRDEMAAALGPDSTREQARLQVEELGASVYRLHDQVRAMRDTGIGFGSDEVRTLNEIEASLSGISGEAGRLAADFAAIFNADTTGDFDPGFFNTLEMELEDVGRQARDTGRTIEQVLDYLITGTHVADQFSKSMAHTGRAFGDLEVHLAAIEARGLDSMLEEGRSSAASLGEQITSLVFRFDEVRRRIDMTSDSGVELDHIFGTLTGHLKEVGEGLREIGKGRAELDVGEQTAKLSKLLGVMDKVSAKSENLLGVNILAPGAEAVDVAIIEASRALDKMGENDALEGVEESFARTAKQITEVRKAARAAREEAKAASQDIMARIDTTLGDRPKGVGALQVDAAEVAARNGIIDRENLERQNALLATSDDLLGRLDAALAEATDTAITFGNAISSADDEFEEHSLNPDVRVAIKLLDRFGLAGSEAGDLLLVAGGKFEIASQQAQALAVAMARLVGSRDLLVEAFDRMPTIGGPDAIRAYGTFGRELQGQAGQMKRRGVQFGPQDTDPFPDHRGLFASAERFKVPVLSTESTGAHALLTNVQNDLFRAVHDYFEHFLIKADFSRWGEEAAFQVGRQQFKSADARRAFASETRGQNAHLIRTGDFPEQKAALLPDHLIGEARPMAGRGLMLPPKTELEVLTAVLREQRNVTDDESRMIAGLLDILVQLGQATAAEATYMRAAADATALATRELGAFERQVNAADDALVGHSLVPSLRELLNLMGDIPGVADRDAAAFALIAHEVERLDLVTAEAESELRRLVGIANGGLIDAGDLGLIDVGAAQNALTVVSVLRKGIGGLDTIRMGTLERSLAGISDRTNLIRAAVREAFGAMQLGLINADTAIDMVDQSMRGLEASFNSTMVKGTKGAADFVLHLREVQKVAASQLGSLPETDPYADLGGVGVNKVRDEVKATMLAVVDVKEAARTLPDAFSGEIVDSLRKGIESSTRSALELNLEARQLAEEWDQIDNGIMRFNSLATQALGSVGGLLKSIGTASDVAPLQSLAEGYRGLAADIEAAIQQILTVYDKLTQSEIKNELISGMMDGAARQLTESLYELGDAVAQVDYFLEGGSLNPALGRCLELLREVRAETDTSAAALAAFGRAVFETDDDLEAMSTRLVELVSELDRLGLVGDRIGGFEGLADATADEVRALEKMIRSIRTGTDAFQELNKAGEDAIDIADRLTAGQKAVAISDQAGNQRQFIQGRNGQLINPSIDPEAIASTQKDLVDKFNMKKDPGGAQDVVMNDLSDLDKLIAKYRQVTEARRANWNTQTDADHNKVYNDMLDLLTKIGLALDNYDLTDFEAALQETRRVLERIYDVEGEIIQLAFEMTWPDNDIADAEAKLERFYDIYGKIQDNPLELVSPEDLRRMHTLLEDARYAIGIVDGLDASLVISDDLASKLGLNNMEAAQEEIDRIATEIDNLHDELGTISGRNFENLNEQLIQIRTELHAVSEQLNSVDFDNLDPKAIKEMARALQFEERALIETQAAANDYAKALEHLFIYTERDTSTAFAAASALAGNDAREARQDLESLVNALKAVADESPKAAATLRLLGREITGADDHLEKHSLNPNLRKLIGLLKDVTVAPITKLTAAFRSADAASTALVSSPGGGGFGKGFTKSFDDFDEKAKNFKRKTGDVKSQLRNMVQGAAAGLGFQQVGKFLLDTVKEVSAVNEAGNKVTVVFDQAADSVKSFASTAVTTIGQSEKQALNAAGTFGNLFTGLGVNSDLAADLSVNMVRLASDISSFSDIPIDDALEKFRSGLSGEFEPLKALGVAINEVSLEQEAMRLGFKKNGDTLDPTVKALAVYNLVLKQTANAQGDFQNTSQSLANQQRILSAEFHQAQLEIGEALLPTAIALVKAIRDNIPAFKEAALIVARFASVFVTSLIPVMNATIATLGVMLSLLEKIGPAGVGALVAFAGFLKLNSILGATRKEAAALAYQMKTLKAGEKVDPSQFGWVTQQKLKLEELAVARRAEAEQLRKSAASQKALAAANASGGVSGASKTAAAAAAASAAADANAAAKLEKSASRAAKASSAISKIGSALPIVGAGIILLGEAWGSYEEKVNKAKAAGQEMLPAIVADNKALVEQGKILDATNITFGEAVKTQTEAFLKSDIKDGGDVTKGLGKVADKIKELNATRPDGQKFANALDTFRFAAAGAGVALGDLLELEANLGNAKIKTRGAGGKVTTAESPEQIKEITDALRAQGLATAALNGEEVTLNDGRIVRVTTDSKVIDAARSLATTYQVAIGLINDQTKAEQGNKTKKDELADAAKRLGVSEDLLKQALSEGGDATSYAALTAEELRKRLTGVAGAQLALETGMKKYAETVTGYKEKLRAFAGTLDVSGKAAERAKARQDALAKSYEGQKKALESQKTAIEAAKTAAEAAIDIQIAAVQKLNEEETARVDALKEQEQAAREVFSTFVGQIDAFSGVISEASGKAGERLSKLNADAQKAIDDLQKQLDGTTDPTLIDSLNKQLDAAKANLEGLPQTAEASLQDLNDVITSNLTSTAEFVSNINVLLARGADDLAKFLLSQGKDAAAALREAVNLNDGALSEQERFIEASKATNAAQKSEVEAMVDYLDGVTVPDLNLIPEPDKASLTKSFEAQIASIDKLIAALDEQASAAQAAAAEATPDDYLQALNEQNNATASYLANLQLLRDNDLNSLADFYLQQGVAGATALQALVDQHRAELENKQIAKDSELAQQEAFTKGMVDRYNDLLLAADAFAADLAAAGAKAGEGFRLELIANLKPEEILDLLGKLKASTGLADADIKRYVLEAAGLKLTGLSNEAILQTIQYAYGNSVSGVIEAIKNQGLEWVQKMFTALGGGGVVGLGADGGVYDKPTNMIIGEAGPEVLLPLSNPQRSLDLAKASGLFGVLAKATGFATRMGADGAMAGAVPGGVEQTNITIEQLVVQVTVPAGTTDPAAFGAAAAQGTVNRLKAIAAIRAS